MSKTALKRSLHDQQNGQCAITASELKQNLSLVDIDRITERKNGGVYTKDNSRILDPVAHMERHGIYKKREEQLDALKTSMDGRFQVRKLLNSIVNRMLAMDRRVDAMDEATYDFLKEQESLVQKRLSKIDRKIEKQVKEIDVPIAQSALGVKGVGPITVAYMLIYIDIEKANYCSSLWSYVGLHTPSHKRYSKGESGGGNKTLRTALYTMATSMEKNRDCPYRDVYDQHKERLSKSEKTTTTRNTQGKMVEDVKWKDVKPGHRRGSALRVVMKHFLADWWFVHRTLEGLETASPYAIEKLGHHTWISPKERGWTY